MKKKVTIKFLDDNPKEFEVKVRDTEYLNIVNKNKFSITKNKKQYTRKQKHRMDIWNQKIKKLGIIKKFKEK